MSTKRTVLHMTIDAALKGALIERAAAENRSLANLVETVLFSLVPTTTAAPFHVVEGLSVRFKQALSIKPSGCWEWARAQNSNGYGNCSMLGKTEAAHRSAWRVFKGELPPGSEVLHKCDNRLCCNPEHLVLGTHADNMADMRKKGRARNGRK